MKQTASQKCATTELKLLGDFWTLAIIQELSNTEKRFCQLERNIPNINPTTLTNRLKRLEEYALIKRQEETIDQLSVVYTLTHKGRGILPILAEIQLFAQKFL